MKAKVLLESQKEFRNLLRKTRKLNIDDLMEEAEEYYRNLEKTESYYDFDRDLWKDIVNVVLSLPERYGEVKTYPSLVTKLKENNTSLFLTRDKFPTVNDYNDYLANTQLTEPIEDDQIDEVFSDYHFLLEAAYDSILIFTFIVKALIFFTEEAIRLGPEVIEKLFNKEYQNEKVIVLSETSPRELFGFFKTTLDDLLKDDNSKYSELPVLKSEYPIARAVLSEYSERLLEYFKSLLYELTLEGKFTALRGAVTHPLFPAHDVKIVIEDLNLNPMPQVFDGLSNYTLFFYCLKEPELRNNTAFISFLYYQMLEEKRIFEKTKATFFLIEVNRHFCLDIKELQRKGKIGKKYKIIYEKVKREK